MTEPVSLDGLRALQEAAPATLTAGPNDGLTGTIRDTEGIIARFHRRNGPAMAELAVAAVNSLPLLIQVAEAARVWKTARDRTNVCHDEFGWGNEGDAACVEYQQLEDDAAEALVAALAAVCPNLSVGLRGEEQG